MKLTRPMKLFKPLLLALAAAALACVGIYGAGSTTINSSRTINGDLTVKGTCTGCGGGGGYVLIQQHTVSGAASVNFPSTDSPPCISSTYDTYQIVINNLLPDGSARDLWLRMSIDGTTYDSGSNYNSNDLEFLSGGTGTGGGAAGQTKFSLARSISTAANQSGLDATITLSMPASSIYKKLYGNAIAADTTGDPRILGWQYAFQYQSTSAILGFQVLPSTGNITGTVRCYGLAKS